MNQLEFHRNTLQMDYFSDSYHRFETDFYRYSALNTPLTFLTDDIMRSMANSQKPFFKLNKENAKDNRDHYFLFRVEAIDNNKLIRKYIYEKSMTTIKEG